MLYALLNSAAHDMYLSKQTGTKKKHHQTKKRARTHVDVRTRARLRDDLSQNEAKFADLVADAAREPGGAGAHLVIQVAHVTILGSMKGIHTSCTHEQTRYPRNVAERCQVERRNQQDDSRDENRKRNSFFERFDRYIKIDTQHEEEEHDAERTDGLTTWENGELRTKQCQPLARSRAGEDAKKQVQRKTRPLRTSLKHWTCQANGTRDFPIRGVLWQMGRS